MIGRKLSFAAKQLVSSSSAHTSLFHTSNTPEQAVKHALLSFQKKLSASHSSRKIAAEAPPATHKTPPCALSVELEKPDSSKGKDCDDDDRPRRRPWQPPSRAKQVDEVEKKKKKKKRAPPGPIEFENLTSTSPAHSNLPFAFRYSYTEIPKVAAVGFQEKFSPFGPGRLDRAWDGQQAFPSAASSSPPPMPSASTLSDNNVLNMKKSKYSFKWVKLINPPSPQPSCTRPRRVRTREEVLGEPLTPEETKILVENASKHKTRRQINMGRDGLTHNMLIEIQDHWKREPVVRIRCKGVCTVDMDNVHFQLEDKTGGKIIERVGGTLYLFRGRNFRYKDRPVIPPMLWRPHAPLYPKLITETPGGLKVHVANSLRKQGLKIMRLCILSKNSYYGDLIRHVREAFEDDELVRIDCKGLNRSDYKKIGAKLRDLVPCYLMSFDKEQIILWRGRDKLSSNTDSSNAEETNGANVQRAEHGGQMVVGQSEDLSSIKSCCGDVCEDLEQCHSVVNLKDNSDEAVNRCDSSDENLHDNFGAAVSSCDSSDEDGEGYGESSAFSSGEDVESSVCRLDEAAESSAFSSDEDSESSAFSEESIEA